jgi:hypothetical protein
MRSTQPSTLTLFQVCDNANGFFDPIGASMKPNKHQALAELRELRKRYPQAYLAQVVFTRCPDRQKGR